MKNLFPAHTSSAAETRRLGRTVAKQLRAGDVIGLYGNLGAGKTVFTQGLCEGLGLASEQVTSPTFSLLHEYDGGTWPVYHFDACRIEKLDEFFDLGYEEYFYGHGVCIVEWAERVEPLLPPETLRFRMKHETGNGRSIHFGGIAP